jgi:2-dehydro-3-deoxyphosphogluconate aldolase/(4S)-4-hydroxy-2-oxoglutarate aldolase
LIEIGLSAKVPVIPGAMTPTEIVQAWQAGAEAVKVFPIKTLGGVEYIKALSPVISHIPLIPTGGVTLEDADQYLQAGAIAVGIASSLFAQAEDNPDWTSLISRSQLLVGKIQPYQTAPTILPSKES